MMSHELARVPPATGPRGGADVADTLRRQEAALAARERELAAFLQELRALRTRYIEQVGALYIELAPLEEAIAAEQVRLGLRLAEIDAEGADGEDAANGRAGDPLDPSCGSQAGVPDGLKQMFRNVAKALHPDLAMDAPARDRRQSLMAEANRAYAERDAERLQLILRAWEESPEAVDASHPYGERLRAERRLAQIEQRLMQIDVEFADLKDSAVNRLKISMEESARHGRDLLEQMRVTVRREIDTATKRLATLRRR